jgi:hypothetical protein
MLAAPPGLILSIILTMTPDFNNTQSWPKPITNRGPEKKDYDELGCVQYLDGEGYWRVGEVTKWEGEGWYHTPRWKPRPLTLQERALEALDRAKPWWVV